MRREHLFILPTLLLSAAVVAEGGGEEGIGGLPAVPSHLLDKYGPEYPEGREFMSRQCWHSRALTLLTEGLRCLGLR